MLRRYWRLAIFTSRILARGGMPDGRLTWGVNDFDEARRNALRPGPCPLGSQRPARSRRGEGLAAGIHADDDVIAVAQAATRHARSHPAFKAATGLLGKVLDVHLAQQAADTNVKVADLAMAQCVDLDAVRQPR